MHILMINGSPREKSNTLEILKLVEKTLANYDKHMTFEYIELAKFKLEMCKGCYACLSLGEEYCQIKDHRAIIEEKMVQADGVIFGSPVYVANLSGTFKNFLDRFAYICHRPRFHGKPAMMVSTTGSVASGIVNMLGKIALETWGFEVNVKIGAIISPSISETDRQQQACLNHKKVQKGSEAFYKALISTKKIKATFSKLLAFHLQKASFKYADPQKADFIYWKEKGWLKKSEKYYMDASINPVVNGLCKLIAKSQLRKYPKGRFLNEL